MDIVPVLLVVTFIVLLVCYFLQSRLQSLGFSVDQLLLGGLGGIAFVPARTSSLPLKYLRLEALKFELVSKGKLFSLSLREVRVRLILPHGQNGASSRPAQESTASKTSQDWTSKKEELSRKLDRLRSLIFWLHIPSISRFFGVFISDVVVDVQFGVLPESPSLKLCINEAFIGLKSAKLEENGKSSRRHGDLALQLEVKVKGFEIRNDLDQCLARLSSIQGLLEKDKSEETIKLPTCAITLEELTVFSKSLMEWSNALKKERPTPSKFSDQVRMLLTPSQSVSGSPLTPQTPKLNSALLNELMEQLEDAWEKMATFQPVLKVALHQTRICHAESKDLVFDLTLTGSSLTLEYSKPTKTLGLSAQMTDILGTVAIHDDDFTLVKLAEGDLKVGLRPPHIHVSQNRERSHIQLDIKNLQVSINNILIRILLHHKAQQSSLSTPAPPPLRQDSIQRIVLLIHTFLHMYQFTLKIQLTDTAALLSMVNYKESNNMAFLARVRVVNLAFDTNVAMDHEPLPELKRTLGHGNLVASTLTMGILESTSRDPLLSDSLDNVQKVAETLGLSLKCAVILESIRLDNRKKSFVKLQFIGGSELLLGNLTGIRDDSDKIDYKALLRSLKDTFQLPKEVRKKRISEFPLVTSGSLECPEIRIDCLSEKIDMGSRLEIRDLVVQMGTEDDSLNPLTKLQLGTLMVITFQANRFAEMHQSLKNVAIKVQGISCQVRKELSIDCQMEHASLTFSTLDLYIAIVSLQHLIRISKVPPQNGAIKPFSPIPIIVLLDRLDVKWTLATDVVLKLHLTPFKSTIQDELIQLSIEEVGMAALVDPTINRFESLGLIRDLDVKVNKSLKFLDDASLFSITIQGKNLLITVPNGYKLEDVIENMINLGKFIKELSMTHLDFVPSGYCKDGRTVIDPTEIPRIHVAVAELVFIMQDDPFEIRLNQNYHVGLREQLSRLVRDRAFEKQVSMRRDVSKKDAEFSK